MTALSHPPAGLSMRLLLVLGLVALGGAALARGSAAVPTSPYYGRWTVSEDRPVFTARGRLYKTIDLAPCGSDVCGVSVNDQGQCGATLFRFLSRHAGEDAWRLRGHGRWGDDQKNLEIYRLDDSDARGGRSFELYLGDGHDFGGRAASMPKFHAAYRRQGGASCRTR
jgi:hypothetical protein